MAAKATVAAARAGVPGSSPERQLGLLWGAVAAIVVALAPLGELLASGLGECLFKTVVGLPCLSCGATRAALALARFDFAAAVAINPLAAAGWAVLVGGGLVAGAAALGGRPLAAPGALTTPSLRLRLGIVATALANWAYLVVHGT